MDLISLVVVCLNCSFYLVSSLLDMEFLHGVICFINVLAFVAAFLISFLFYQEYTLFLYADDAIGAQIACVVVLIVLLFLILPVYLKLKFDEDLDDIFGNFPVWIGLAFVVFHTLCVGISYVLLGRTINDPWGSTSCTGPLGVLQAVLDAVIPIFIMIMSILQGGLEE